MIVSVLVTVVLFALLAYLAMTGWPGEVGQSGTGFCEALRPGPIKQPANTWSNLGFVIAGLMIAYGAGRDLARPKSPQFDNPIISSRFFATTYSLTGVLIGMGSGALHASTTKWGGQVDIYSMFLWATWVISYSFIRLIGRPNAVAFLACFVPLSVLLAIEVFLPAKFNQVSNSDLFGVLIVCGIFLELVTRYYRRKEFTTSVGYLGWAVVSFLAAYAAWLPSRTGGPICYPESMWQGHALWHVLCAFSVGFVYLYGRSQRQAVVA